MQPEILDIKSYIAVFFIFDTKPINPKRIHARAKY